MVDDDLPIINLVMADINAVVPNFASLVSAYRLLVGSAEEIRRTPGVPLEIFQRAVLRYDRAGTLIDLLLELLCCKIVFASKFLSTVCAPIDLPRYVANESEADYTLRHTAEQVLLMEILRLGLSSLCEGDSCFGPPPPGIGCPPVPPLHCPQQPGGMLTPPQQNGAPPTSIDADADDLLQEIAPEILTSLTNFPSSSTQTNNPGNDMTDTTALASGIINSPRDTAPSPRRKHYAKGSVIRKQPT